MCGYLKLKLELRILLGKLLKIFVFLVYNCSYFLIVFEMYIVFFGNFKMYIIFSGNYIENDKG